MSATSIIMAIFLTSASYESFQLVGFKKPKGELVTFKEGATKTECIKARKLNKESVAKHTGQAVFRGYHPQCNLVGFAFKDPNTGQERDTLWMRAEDVVIENKVQWVAYMSKNSGGGVVCTSSRGMTASTNHSQNTQAIIRGFCPR